MFFSKKDEIVFNIIICFSVIGFILVVTLGFYGICWLINHVRFI